MYKIYINDHVLWLCSDSEVNFPTISQENKLILRYSGKKKFLLNLIDKLEKSSYCLEATVFHTDPEEMWETFCSVYKIIEAAGGVVKNTRHETLLIYRRNSWDLPKGKIDPGETPPQAALREVREETGLQNLTLGNHLADTWHTYEMKGKRILKRTWWFAMETTDFQLIPQTEEDIEQAVWVDLKTFLANPPAKVYKSILDVLKAADQ